MNIGNPPSATPKSLERKVNTLRMRLLPNQQRHALYFVTKVTNLGKCLTSCLNPLALSYTNQVT